VADAASAVMHNISLVVGGAARSDVAEGKHSKRSALDIAGADITGLREGNAITNIYVSASTTSGRRKKDSEGCSEGGQHQHVPGATRLQ